MLAGKKINSLQDAFALLNCHRLSARLNTSEVALLLGRQVGPSQREVEGWLTVRVVHRRQQALDFVEVFGSQTAALGSAVFLPVESASLALI